MERPMTAVDNYIKNNNVTYELFPTIKTDCS